MKLINGFFTNLGQTFFMPNVYLGGVIFLAVLLNHPLAGALGLFSVIVCRRVIDKMGANQNLSNLGFVDVNAFYMGAALGYFFHFNMTLVFITFLMGIFVARLVVICQRILSPWQLPMLVLPFIVGTSLVWYLKDNSSFFYLNKFIELEKNVGIYSIYLNWGAGVLRSISQVFFAQSLGIGAFVLLGMFIISKKLFQVILIAASLSCGFGLSMGLADFWVPSGLLGYNALLVAAAYLSLESDFKWVELCSWVLLSCLLSVALSSVMYRVGLLSLSLPYVMVVWVFNLSKARRNTLSPVARQGSSWLTTA